MSPSKTPVANVPRRVKLSGTPREIGQQHGQQLKSEIHGQIEVYADMFRVTLSNLGSQTSAGLVGKIGFNSASVAVCMNAIRAKPTDSSKIPFHVATRICLNSNSAAEAKTQLKELGSLASTQHILIADPEEGPTTMELSPRGDVYIKPDADGIVCHTNHLIENKYVHSPPWLAGSPIRLERMNRLTHEVAASGKAVTGEILRTKVFNVHSTPLKLCAAKRMKVDLTKHEAALSCASL